MMGRNSVANSSTGPGMQAVEAVRELRHVEMWRECMQVGQAAERLADLRRRITGEIGPPAGQGDPEVKLPEPSLCEVLRDMPSQLKALAKFIDEEAAQIAEAIF